MMTLDEMKSAVCKKLPELLTNVGTPQQTVVDYWHDKTRDRYPIREINWPTEGLQVCHEAEKLLDREGRWLAYAHTLAEIVDHENNNEFISTLRWVTTWPMLHA